MVAPASEQSGSSHSLTLREPIETVKLDDNHYRVAGTPTECAKSLETYLEAGLQEPVIQVSGTEEEKSLALDVIRQFTGA